ncbi:helix-turn-helix transcriptional regulator [Streptomyces sp. XD-27]|uniref:helix-turn-helix domain-containing protein n=1 Tax=Streptomyces sp. XD-27 TaxID=3062779 RepID=UPI0026F410BC|nr:helix-turn-helix transcriptional regulator [Streptomyces sp. XD-27]WKX72679.1 helix-turn-helix transcriptional regulator [Streptomyces sp. XD-27]
MTHAHVSYGIQAAYGLQVHPATVAAWELGEAFPTETELTALAGALWCSPGDLLGSPSTLREHRVAQGLAPIDVAMRISMDPQEYERMEQSGTWTGNDAQAAQLGDVLRLPLRALFEVTGRDAALAELLRSAVDTRWQAYVKKVGKLVPLPKPQLEGALKSLYADYQVRIAATLSRGAVADNAAVQAREFLDGIVHHFWDRVEGAAR